MQIVVVAAGAVSSYGKKRVPNLPKQIPDIVRCCGERLQFQLPECSRNAALLHFEADDVIRLVQTYELTLYGLSRYKSTNGYEQRRQAAFAEVSNTKLKAAAAASAIAFPTVKLAPGQSTDGALFYATQGRPLGAGRLSIRAAGDTFAFDPIDGHPAK